MFKRVVPSFALLVVAALLAVPSASARPSSAERIPRVTPSVHRARPGVAGPTRPRTLTPLAREFLSRGYLSRDPAELAAAKANAEADNASSSGRSTRAGRTPTVGVSWDGVQDPNVSPSDSNGAIGTTRYIETVNDQFGIYDRTGTLKRTGSLNLLTGDSNPDLTDPVVSWDPATKRFYYVVLNFDVVFGPGDGIDFDFGYSKTASPNSESDFCQYFTSGYDAAHLLPDYEKMGFTKDFILFGANVFNAITQGFASADVEWISKPAAGTTCQDPMAFNLGIKQNLKNSNGTQAFTPEPARQTDTASTGWVVSNVYPGTGSASQLQLFRVRKNATTGDAVIQSKGTPVTVAAFQVPPPVPQKGTTKKLDSLDSRLMNAVTAIDPAHDNVMALWTQHTVKGGAGTQVRWYEINPTTATLIQNGTVTSDALFVFNGAVAPDRLVNGSTKAFGDAIVVGFNTSSSTAFPAIQMVSKIGTGAQSGFVLVQQSPAAENDFTCSPCRWGDYSSASPDPGASALGSHGNVWLTNMWSTAGASSNDVDWDTWNWQATP